MIQLNANRIIGLVKSLLLNTHLTQQFNIYVCVIYENPISRCWIAGAAVMVVDDYHTNFTIRSNETSCIHILIMKFARNILW